MEELENYEKQEVDNITPEHYKAGDPYEVINIIEGYGLGFNLGNVIKYALRAGVKNPETYTEDLRKAAWYLEREINNNLF